MNPAFIKNLYPEEVYRFSYTVMIVLERSWKEYSAAEKTLLTKILGSVRVNIASAKICTTGDFKSMSAGDPTIKVIIFGGAPAEIPTYQPTQAQGFSVVRADDLSQLDDARKKNLWNALKQMFAV